MGEGRMGTMLERVGRVIAKAQSREMPSLQDFEIARAVIEAMREPTDAMSAAGLIADGTYAGWHGQHKNPTLTPEEAERIGLWDHLAANPVQWKKPLWRAMIDAALPPSRHEGEERG